MGAQDLEKLGRKSGKGGGEVVAPEVRADLKIKRKDKRKEGGGEKRERSAPRHVLQREVIMAMISAINTFFLLLHSFPLSL